MQNTGHLKHFLGEMMQIKFASSSDTVCDDLKLQTRKLMKSLQEERGHMYCITFPVQYIYKYAQQECTCTDH